MKEKNVYTIPLSLLGIASLLYMGLEGSGSLVHILPLLLLIAILDLFPVRLLSGEEYSGSLAGFLILLLAYGPVPALYGILISNMVSHLRSADFIWRKFNIFRLLSTQGKYSICLYAAHMIMERLDGTSIYVQAGAGALTFSLLYMLLAAIVKKTISGIPLLNNLVIKCKEIAVPVVLCTIIVPHFLVHLSLNYMVYETIYILLFLMLIIFFSYGYIRQVRLRRRGAEEFIRIGEMRISNRMEGHGHNVGIICEHVLELLGYPKKRRVDLINMAAIHDIGKMMLPLDILTKRGARSLSEEQQYQSHPVHSSKIVLNVSGDKKMSDWILHHHERYDGKGYPDGLKEKQIPYESRIIHMCDQLEYLMRHFEQDEEVIRRLENMSHKELDPELVSHIHTGTVAGLRQYMVYIETPGATELTSVIEPDKQQHRELSSITGGTRLLKYMGTGSLQRHEDLPSTVVYDLEILAARALVLSESFYEVLVSQGNTYEAHFYPESDWVAVVLNDITPALQYREDMHLHTLRAYRDVIRTLSHSKIDICLKSEEIVGELGEWIDEMEVNTRADVASSRTLVVQHIPEDFRLEHSKKVMSIKLAVSEAVTNLIKHAEEGKVAVYQKSGCYQIYITDHGSGIPLHELPKTILISGYSSKSSLGKGFALMYASADRIMLHTSPEGTAILLEFNEILEQAI
ncbi:HD domain-containing phosphohydrolase [Paenibacillus shenyangensis]|uniref:HD domain-containing phosphohydrolase n=1 Tax=Paenibacillus sp. A9 TaxID=1284352 RepID=UPI00035C8C93|nr:HD domain-containing phosphohydrolase [Paenibacillus sp. A9]